MTVGQGKGILQSRTILLIAIVQGFLYVNAHVWWGADWPSEGVNLYLFLECIFLGLLGYGIVIQKKDIPWANTEFHKAILHWMFGFWITLFVVYAAFEFGLGHEWDTIRSAQVLPVFLFQMIFVTPVEEIIFRGVIPTEVAKYERFKIPVMLIGSQVLFAVFHWAAYGGLGIPMLYAFCMGMVWIYATRKWSIYWAMGSHLAWNCLIMGILSGGII